MRLFISLFFLHFCSAFLAQSGAWIENTEFFADENLYQLGTYLFEDGSFQITKNNYRFKFDNQGVLKRELIQEITEQEAPSDQQSGGCSAFELEHNIRYTLADNILHIEHLFPDKKNEYRAIPLEKQEHVVKSVWDQYSDKATHTDAGIVTAIPGKVILYQTYYAISKNTHPDRFKPKGINTYLRLSVVNLADYSVSYEYLLIDVFNPDFGKKKEVLDLFDFKCIGMNEKQELLFSVSKTSFKDRDAPPFTLSDYKTVDYCKSGIEVWTVNLGDFSQKKVYSGVIESSPKATSVSMSFGNNGWILSWTEPRDTYYTFQARSFRMDADYDVVETTLRFPSQELKLTGPQTPNIRVFKGFSGENLFCLAVPNYPSLFVMDENAKLVVRNNSILNWDLNRDMVLSDTDILCLPCSKELSSGELRSLSDLPGGITPDAPHTRILKFRKAGNTVFYLHMESLNRINETGQERIRRLYLKNGKIEL